MSASILIGVDPGPERSGWVVLKDGDLYAHDITPNEQMRGYLRQWHDYELVIEMIASYGMAVGKDVFETCVWIGRFIECAEPNPIRRITRGDVKLHICGTKQAKDPNVRQALIDMYPATGGGKTPQIGTIKQPGPLYGMAGDMWAALAVAVTAAETRI